MITSYPQAPSVPYNLLVSQGKVPGVRNITVFGYNPDVDQTEITVWPLASILPSPPSATVMTVSSTSANDTAAGTGARTILLTGLDSTHTEITESVTLNGTTAVTTTKSFLHLNEGIVTSAGSTNSAAGSIYIGTGAITAGVPAIIYNVIKFDYNNFVTGSYTIPAGYTAYLSQGMFTTGQDTGSTSVRGRLLIITADKIVHTIAVTTVNNGIADYTFEYPVAIAEKTTVEARAVGSANNNSVSSMFILALVKN